MSYELPNLSEMPPEVKLQIAENLSPFDLERLGETSAQFNDIRHLETLWKSLTLRDYPGVELLPGKTWKQTYKIAHASKIADMLIARAKTSKSTGREMGAVVAGIYIDAGALYLIKPYITDRNMLRYGWYFDYDMPSNVWVEFNYNQGGGMSFIFSHGFDEDGGFMYTIDSISLATLHQILVMLISNNVSLYDGDKVHIKF